MFQEYLIEKTLKEKGLNAYFIGSKMPLILRCAFILCTTTTEKDTEETMSHDDARFWKCENVHLRICEIQHLNERLRAN